jgi:putative thioredoxin
VGRACEDQAEENRMIDVSNFEEQVLQASREKPVLVDFWAPWCGPCRQLGPILERLADEPGAPFTLAKLNTDEDQATAMRYGIRSIPAVKLFVDGEVVDEFIGALPEAQVRTWLQRAIPSETRRLVQEARDALAGGDDAQAEALLEKAMALEPANAEAALLLAKLVVFKDPARATQLSHTHGANYAEAEAIRRVAEALTEGAPSDLPEDPARAPYAAALAALQDGDTDVALAQLVDSIRRNRHFHDDAARKLALALFSVLGDKHPLTQKHRRALERALF